MKSKIADADAVPIFRAKVLNQHDVEYFRCVETGFIQTQPPFWLSEAYSDAITTLDIGLISRNIDKSVLASRMIDQIVPAGGRFIDYGGGYGIFTRLMRDQGYSFQSYDPHCACLFAKGFSIDRLPSNDVQSFDCLTAWEVFEHLPDPMITIAELLRLSDNILFSTIVVPTPSPTSVSDWWYFAPEIGQHVSFYTLKSLHHIAHHFGVNFYSDGEANHLFSRQSFSFDPFAETWRDRLEKKVRTLTSRLLSRTKTGRTSLRENDYLQLLALLRDSNHPSEGRSLEQASSPD